jgi:hypothetical protein
MYECCLCGASYGPNEKCDCDKGLRDMILLDNVTDIEIAKAIIPAAEKLIELKNHKYQLYLLAKLVTAEIEKQRAKAKKERTNKMNEEKTFGIFDFLSITKNYEDRKVDKYKCKEFIVDTCWINDNDPPYESAVSHKDFNNGSWCVLEHYDTKEKAQIGHNKWVNKFKNDEVDVIVDDTPKCFVDIGIKPQTFYKQNT